MKNFLLLIAILIICVVTASAQTVSPDTGAYNYIIKTQKQVIDLIGKSDIPAKEADQARQSMYSIIQYLESQKQAIIAEEKRKKQTSAKQ